MLLHLKETTSTMDVAKSLVEKGDIQTTAVLADSQTSARGRHNRPWLTFGAPHSLMVTYIERPATGPHLPLLVALALYEAVLPCTTGKDLRIKWPNDLLLDGKKLAGILCQNVGTGVGQGASLIGIGLNISPPASVPPTFLGTFLNAEIPPETLVSAITTCLQPLLALYGEEGWTPLLHQSYLQRCSTIGQKIRWQTAENNELTGLVRGLTPNGHLEMVEEDGTVHVIHSGEIFDKRPQ